MAKAAKRSSKAETTYSRDHEIGHDYDGLKRALDDSHALLGKHEIRVADFHPVSPDGSMFRLHLRSGTLAKLTPPVVDGWIVEPSEGSPRARVILVDEDEDRLIVQCSAPKPGHRFANKLRLSAPDFLVRLREWLTACAGKGFPPLLERLKNTPISELRPQDLNLSSAIQDALRQGQRDALSRVGAGIVHLWGPPGTGKTHTVARAVQSLVARGYKVALIAPTNVAVDTAVLAISQAYQQGGDSLEGGFLVRAGQPALERLEQHPELLAWQHTLRSQQAELRVLNRRQKELERDLSKAQGAERQLLNQEKAELKQQVENCQKERAEELWRLAKSARIMATTVHSALHREEMLAFFAAPNVALIVDEAGMVPRYAILPLLELLGGGEALQKGTLLEPPGAVTVVLAGDPRQLGPIHRQRNESDVNLRYWMGQSLMEELLEPNGMGESAQLALNTPFLDEQSRMDTSICRRISRTYYRDRLKTVADHARPSPPLLTGWPEDGVVIVDPKKVELPSDAPPPSFLDVEAKRNEWNLWIALKLIREALAEGRARSAMWLTPFRDQAHLALKFRDVHFSDLDVRVGTVHTSQGGEADLVVFDPVNIGHRWLKGMIGGDLDIERMLNVAISRARGQAIVFATAQDLKNNDLFRRLLHDAARWDGGK